SVPDHARLLVRHPQRGPGLRRRAHALRLGELPGGRGNRAGPRALRCLARARQGVLPGSGEVLTSSDGGCRKPGLGPAPADPAEGPRRGPAPPATPACSQSPSRLMSRPFTPITVAAALSRPPGPDLIGGGPVRTRMHFRALGLAALLAAAPAAAEPLG